MKTQINIYSRLIGITLLLFLLISSVSAQNKLIKARNYKSNFEYSKAIHLYLEYFKTRTPEPNDVRDIANCYVMMNDLASAQEWLSKYNTFYVYSAPEMLNYANALKAAGQYDDAMKQFIRFQQIFPAKAEKFPTWMISCVDAKKWTNNPANYYIKNVAELNSENSDYGIIPVKGEYIYSSDRKHTALGNISDEIFGWTGNPYLKLYKVSNINEEKIKSDTKIIDELNSQFHNGSGVFDEKTNTFYYTVTKMKENKALPTNSDPTNWEAKETPDRYVNRMEIYISKLVDNKWEKPVPFQYNNSDYYSIGHPALSPDGKTLYFASNMPGGLGGSDLYYCKLLNDNTWSKPQNLGDLINTDDKEAFPVVDKDGTLYFSSNGHSGMGGLDIFATNGSEDSWTIPENLKFPLNSPKDDFSPVFTKTGISGYLSSNRDGGKGEDDIYYFAKGLVIKGRTFAKVFDNSIVPLESADISIVNLNNKKIVSKVSDLKGEFLENALCSNTYEITAQKKGYFMQTKNVDAVCLGSNDTVYVDLILDQIFENKSYVLENIYYDFDKWYIRPDAAIELDKLVALLNQNPEIDIELGSHTDSRGTDIYNQKLSQKRAEAAVEYIINKGIDANRITAKGYGEFKHAVNCTSCSEEEHQMNRRTEFTITKIRNNEYSMLLE